MKKFSIIALVLCTTLLQFPAFSQDHPHLHIRNKWKECSFQLDPSLTQKAWHQFAKEAATVAYFRPLAGADALEKGKLDFSILQWQTRIDENSEAWNNTFVHPDSTHWLVDGPRLAVPGLALRAGLTGKLDAGVYWTTNPNANYSIAGAMLQYSFLKPRERGLALASRLNWSTIYGPEDLNFSIYGIDVVGSYRLPLYSNWLALNTYAYTSLMLSHAKETTTAVNLKDENNLGYQAAAGAVLHVYMFQLAAEYNQGVTNTLSYRLGVAFNPFKGRKEK